VNVAPEKFRATIRFECGSLADWRNAGFDRLQHQLHVEAGLLAIAKALRDTGNLDRTHQVMISL